MTVQPPPSFLPPIAIGGLGGSGTRVFAAMLRHFGAYMGGALNEPLDNLWFTILFKRAAWALDQPDPTEIATSTRLFTSAMTTGLRDNLSPDDHALIARLRDDLVPIGNWHCGVQAPRVKSLFTSGPPPGDAPRLWGWKEPNTHIFLPHLDHGIPGFRYIHVVRDGLDMAFSDNTWQARHWGHLFGCPYDPGKPLPPQQLRFWIEANRAALEYGQAHMQGRFLVVHYEDFCARPAAHSARIQSFLGLPVKQTLPNDLVRSSTIGRSAEHDLTSSSAADLAEVRALQSVVAKIGQPDPQAPQT